MKVLMKPVEMIAWFTRDGIPSPIRYKITDEEKTEITIKVDKILRRDEERLAGNRMVTYRCQSIIDCVERIYELKYEVSTMKWFLYKM